MRAILAETILASGPLGLLTSATFLAIEMTVVAEYNKAWANRDLSLPVVQRADQWNRSHQQKDAEKFSQALIHYSIGEGFFSDFNALEAAYLQGGKTIIEDAGDPKSTTLLGQYLKKMGIERDGREPVTIEFPDTHALRHSSPDPYAARIVQLGIYRDGLSTLRQALKNRHAAMSDSQLRYDLENFEAEKRIALATLEIEALKKVLSNPAEDREKFLSEFIVEQKLEVAGWAQKETILHRRLFGIHHDLLERFAKRERTIQWDRVHMANFSNYKQAVTASLPEEPEQIYLLGYYLLHRFETPSSPDTPAANEPLVAKR